MPAGRPREYNPRLHPYLLRRFVFERMRSGIIPTKEGAAIFMHVNRDTLLDWSSKHDEFSAAWEYFKAVQGDDVLTKSLTGKYVAPIAKLLLSSHGYTEKKDINLNHSGSLSAEQQQKMDELLKHEEGK